MISYYVVNFQLSGGTSFSRRVPDTSLVKMQLAMEAQEPMIQVDGDPAVTIMLGHVTMMSVTKVA